MPGIHEKVFEKSGGGCGGGCPRDFAKRGASAQYRTKKPQPESRKMLGFAHIWKLLELHFLNPENLISWPAKRVMKQVERQVASCRENGTAQDNFELPKRS